VLESGSGFTEVVTNAFEGEKALVLAGEAQRSESAIDAALENFIFL